MAGRDSMARRAREDFLADLATTGSQPTIEAKPESLQEGLVRLEKMLLCIRSQLFIVVGGDGPETDSVGSEGAAATMRRLHAITDEIGNLTDEIRNRVGIL